MKNFELLFFASADELAGAAAGAWLDEIESASAAGKTHCVALSGGRITQNFFRETVKQTAARKIAFDKVHFFWADERCVPADDPESNFRLANELLFAPLEISEGQIHRLRGEIPPVEAVKLAGDELRRFAGNADDRAGRDAGTPRLDLIFLGMGEDGHIASLFPGSSTEDMNCPAPFLAVENSPKPPPNRISLSYNALAAARQVWVLVSGPGKATALRESLHLDGRTPLARVIQSRSRTKIFSDIRLD